MFGLTMNPLSTGIDSLASDSVGRRVHHRAVSALMLNRQSSEQKNLYQGTCFAVEDWLDNKSHHSFQNHILWTAKPVPSAGWDSDARILTILNTYRHICSCADTQFQKLPATSADSKQSLVEQISYFWSTASWKSRSVYHLARPASLLNQNICHPSKCQQDYNTLRQATSPLVYLSSSWPNPKKFA